MASDSDIEVGEQENSPSIQNGGVEETSVDESEEGDPSLSSQNIAQCEELSSPVRSPDNTLSFEEGQDPLDSSEIIVKPGETVDDGEEQSLNATLSVENEDTFDTEKDFDCISEEDTSVSVSKRHPGSRHPSASDLSESEILKYPDQPHAVIGGKIYPFDMGGEDLIPESELEELPDDNREPQNEVAVEGTLNDSNLLKDEVEEMSAETDQIKQRITSNADGELPDKGTDAETNQNQDSHPDSNSFPSADEKLPEQSNLPTKEDRNNEVDLTTQENHNSADSTPEEEKSPEDLLSGEFSIDCSDIRPRAESGYN